MSTAPETLWKYASNGSSGAISNGAGSGADAAAGGCAASASAPPRRRRRRKGLVRADIALRSTCRASRNRYGVDIYGRGLAAQLERTALDDRIVPAVEQHAGG